MKAFIHTISFKKYISLDDKTKINNTFNDSIIWIAGEKNYIIQRYNIYGVLLKITKNSEAEKKFDKQHHMFKIEIIVNLYKLINPGKEYGMIIEQSELESAIRQLWGILKQVETEAGVCLCDNLILKRVDVAKDVVTPNNDYTLEVIRLSKLALNKYGYKNYTPDEISRKKKWRLEDSSMFYSKSVKAKIYNKKQDLINHNSEPDIEDKGLLRFEVTLTSEAMIKSGYVESNHIELESLSAALYKIICNGENIISRYFKQTLIDGSMIPKELQNKYLKIKYESKKKRLKNMKEYRDAVNKKTKYDFTTDKAYRIKDHFENIRLSPVYSEFPYIPSFSDILDSKIDEELLRFAHAKTKDKNQIFWR